MLTQQDIRDYLVDNNEESTDGINVESRVNLADSVHSEFVRQVIEKFIEDTRTLELESFDEIRREQALQNQKLTEMIDQIMLERDDLKTRLIVAERTSADAMKEIVALRGQINELKNQRQGNTMRDSDHEDEVIHQAGDGSEGDGPSVPVNGVNTEDNQDVQQTILPDTVTPEILSAMVTNHQREEDCYWRSSLMITVGSGEFGDFRSWRHKLYCMGLHFLYHESVSHYVTGRGNLRLTYRSEYEMRKKIIQARKFCKDKNLRNVHIEFMVPPRFVQEKKEMMKKGRQMKANGLIGVYDVLIKWGQPVLRTFSQTQGVQYLKVNQIPEENVTPEMA